MDLLLDFWNSLPEIEQKRVLLGIATAVASAAVVALLRILGSWFQRRIKRVSPTAISQTTPRTVPESALLASTNSSRANLSQPVEPASNTSNVKVAPAPQSIPYWQEQLPQTGTFTFLFTDIEGSTRLWEKSPDTMRQAMVRHDTIIEGNVEKFSGIVVGERGEGDSRFAVFVRATDAVAAAVEIQKAFAKEPWLTPNPVHVRMALHTGEAEVRAGGFYGSDVNRCARIRSLAHGEQTLISQATSNLVAERLPDQVCVSDLGMHRLKDLQRPERIYQLVIPGVPSNFPSLKSLSVLPNNLPLQLTNFIGREREIGKLELQLRDARLITLTGPGGCGKTRLSLQVSANVLEDFADGVWLVEFAPLSDPSLVLQTIAGVLYLRDEPGKPLSNTLVNFLRSKTVLLILDNCEHLVDACAAAAETLLRNCPNIKILVTSREAFGIPGEITFRVPSLAFPDPHEPVSIDTLTQYDSARLFTDRAMTANPEFQLTDPSAVAQICRRLDGIPLAIELAAAKVKVMTAEQIATRLDDRFRLLTGGSRTALPRQQTLRALIDWSYDLLSESERIFLQRFSVFVGSASLQAITSICFPQPDESGDMISELTQLVSKSLIMAEEQEGEMRYRMLETIRQYAQDKLLSSGNSETMRSCHRDFFLRLIEDAEPEMRSAHQATWLNLLALDYDNILAALEWSLANNDTDECLRFGGGLRFFWGVRGYWTQGRERLTRILAMPGATTHNLGRVKALLAAAFLAWRQDDYPVARAFFDEGLAISREINASRETADALYGLGIIAQSQGDYVSARSMYTEGLSKFRETKDQWGTANALLGLGSLSAFQDDLEEARSLFQASLTAFREIGDKRSIAKLLGNLGLIAFNEKDYASAGPLYEEALAIRRELQDKAGIANLLNNLGYVALHQRDLGRAGSLFDESLKLLSEIQSKRLIADVFFGLAGLAAAENKPERAARLFGAGEALFVTIGARIEEANRAEYDRDIAPARSQLSAESFALALAEGRKMNMEQAIAFALNLPAA